MGKQTRTILSNEVKIRILLFSPEQKALLLFLLLFAIVFFHLDFLQCIY